MKCNVKCPDCGLEIAVEELADEPAGERDLLIDFIMWATFDMSKYAVTSDDIDTFLKERNHE